MSTRAIGCRGGLLLFTRAAIAPCRATVRAHAGSPGVIGRRAREARDQATAAASRARHLMQQGTDAMVTSLDQWRSRMNSVIDQGREVVEHGTETVSVAIEQGREAYQRAKAKDLA